MSSHRIASRYAKSLIQLAQENGKLGSVCRYEKTLTAFLKAAAT
jgi:F0F1-type ATP synthase delta subunit